MNSSIGILGAGISGLVAARRLVSSGARVTVFDKGRGPGGRISSRRGERFPFDHGAQYFTCRDDRFIEAVHAWRSAGVVEPWQGRVIALGPDRPVPSDRPGERFVGVPSMSAIARHLSEGLDVVAGTRVAKISRAESGGWSLADSGGRDLGDYDGVILSLPPAQSAELLEEVPDLRAVAQSVELRPCWAALIGFARRYDVDFDGAFLSGSPLSWIARNSSKPSRPSSEAWVLHATPEWSERHFDMDADDAIDALLEALAGATGVPLPPVEHRDSQRWRYALADPPLDQGCFADESSSVFLCGDWCHGSRVEGAFLSGLKVADSVRESLVAGVRRRPNQPH